MRLKPPPGGKHTADWKGKRLRALRDLKNAFGVIAAGTLMTVERIAPGKGINAVTDKCPHCGAQLGISGLSPCDVELVE